MTHEEGTATSARRSGGEAIETSEQLREELREKYGEVARKAAGGGGCCGGGATGSERSDSKGGDPIASGLYDDGDREALPDSVLEASLGSGTPRPW